MNEFVNKLIERLEKELRLADEEKVICARENPLQFDSAKGYANGVYTAISIVKELTAEFAEDTNVRTNDGWIPVEYGLPVDGIPCWTTVNVCGNFFVRADVFTHGNWRNSFNDTVLAWQYNGEPKPYNPYQPKGE